MAQYNQDIAENEKVEFIHVSLDRDDDAAQKWAAKEQFPWFHVLYKDIKRSDLKKFHISGSVPYYCMVDGNGEVVAKGKNASFSKARSVAK